MKTSKQLDIINNKYTNLGMSDNININLRILKRKKNKIKNYTLFNINALNKVKKFNFKQASFVNKSSQLKYLNHIIYNRLRNNRLKKNLLIKRFFKKSKPVSRRVLRKRHVPYIKSIKIEKNFLYFSLCLLNSKKFLLNTVLKLKKTKKKYNKNKKLVLVRTKSLKLPLRNNSKLTIRKKSLLYKLKKYNINLLYKIKKYKVLKYKYITKLRIFNYVKAKIQYVFTKRKTKKLEKSNKLKSIRYILINKNLQLRYFKNYKLTKQYKYISLKHYIKSIKVKRRIFTRLLVFKFRKFKFKKFNCFFITSLFSKKKQLNNNKIRNLKIYAKFCHLRKIKVLNISFLKYWYIFKLLYHQNNQLNISKQILIKHMFKRGFNNLGTITHNTLTLLFSKQKALKYKYYYKCTQMPTIIKSSYFYFIKKYYFLYYKMFNSSFTNTILNKELFYYFNIYLTHNNLQITLNYVINNYELDSYKSDLRLLPFLPQWYKYKKKLDIKTYATFDENFILINKYFIKEFNKTKRFLLLNSSKNFNYVNILNIVIGPWIIPFDVNLIINNFISFRKLILYTEWVSYNFFKKTFFFKKDRMIFRRLKRLYIVVKDCHNKVSKKYLFKTLCIRSNRLAKKSKRFIYWFWKKNSHLQKLFTIMRYKSTFTDFHYYVKKTRKFIRQAVPLTLRCYKYHYNRYFRKLLKKRKLRKNILKYYLIKNNYSKFKLFYLWRWYFIFLNIGGNCISNMDINTINSLVKKNNLLYLNLMHRPDILTKYKYMFNLQYTKYFKYLLYKYQTFYNLLYKRKLFSTFNMSRKLHSCFFIKRFYKKLNRDKDLQKLYLKKIKPTRKNIAIFNIFITYNNIFVTLCTLKGFVVYQACAGTLGITGSKRSTPVACENVVGHVLHQTIKKGIKYIYVKLNGVLYTRKMKAAIKILRSTNKFRVLRFINVTPKAHNGIRLKKRRRI